MVLALSNKCATAYNAINSHNFAISTNLSPIAKYHATKDLERSIRELTKEDWKELKRECPEQYRDLQEFKEG